MSIGTASWFKKIFNCALGADIYAGPKIEGSLEFSTDWINSKELDLSNFQINVAGLSVDLNVGTTASVLGGTEVKKTLFSTNFPFFCDTARFVPRVGLKDFIVDGNTVTYTIKSHKDFPLGHSSMDFLVGDMSRFQNVGHWDYSSTDDEYTNSFSLSDCKTGGKNLFGIRRFWNGKEHSGGRILTEFYVPYTLKVHKDQLNFETYGKVPGKKFADGYYSNSDCIEYTTNSPDGYFETLAPGLGLDTIQVIDEDANRYRAYLRAGAHHELYDKSSTGSIRVGSGNDVKSHEIRVSQKALPLDNVLVYATISYPNGDYRVENPLVFASPDGYLNPVTATRIDQDRVQISGKLVDDNGNITEISFIVSKDQQGKTTIEDGSMSYLSDHYIKNDDTGGEEWEHYHQNVNLSFTKVSCLQLPEGNRIGMAGKTLEDFYYFKGSLTSGSYNYSYSTSRGVNDESISGTTSEGNVIIYIQVLPPE